MDFKIKNNCMILFLLIIFSCEDEKEKKPPEIEIINISNGDSIYEVVPVSWILSDESGIAKTQLWINGLPIESDFSSYSLSDVESNNLITTRATYTYNWNTLGLANDVYEINIFAEDNFGNSDLSESIIVQIDNSLGVPEPVHIVSVIRDGYQADVVWASTDIEDFSKYIIDVSHDSDMSEIIVSDTSESVYDTSKIFMGLDPIMDIYVSVELVDLYDFTAVSQIFTSSKDESPLPVILSAIEYDTTRLFIEWTASNDNDFESYGIYISSSPDLDGVEILNITDKDLTTHEIYDFNPNLQNWYYILTRDTLGQSSQSNQQANNINLPPPASEVISVEYGFDSLTIKWDKCMEFDFSKYVLLRSENQYSGFLPVYTIDDKEQTTYSVLEFDPTVENWFKTQTIDHWSLLTNSEPLSNALDPFPTHSDVTSVSYNNDSLIVEWEQCNDQDFLRFDVLYSDGQPDNFQIIETIDDPAKNSMTLFSFDPTVENRFKIKTVDHWDQVVIGAELSNDIDPFPQISDILATDYENNVFNVEWVKNDEGDFQSYTIYVASNDQMANSVIEYYSEISDETSFTLASENGFIKYFQVGVKDVWGQEALSNPMRGSSYITFKRSYPAEFTDIGKDVLEANDGQYVVTGISSSFGASGLDAFITKKDIFGDDVWFTVHGGVSPEEIWDIIQTPEGGYFVLGSTESYGSAYKDIFLVKVDPNGVEEWIKTYGGLGRDYGRSIIKGSDGLYYIIGSTESFGNGEYDVWLLVVDDQGNEINSYTFGNELNNYGVGLLESTDGGFIILSYEEASESGDHDIIIRKIDSAGLEIWANSFGGPDNETASAIATDGAGTYFVCGSIITNGQRDGLFIGINDQGNVLFSDSYGWGGNDWFSDIIVAPDDGSIILCGVIESNGTDSWLLKIDFSGGIVWERNIGLDGMDYANGLSRTADGGYIITGYSNTEGHSDYILIKTDSEGYSTDPR